MKTYDKLNPLNIAGVRKFNFLPPHLSPIEIQISKHKSKLDVEEWIEQNLSGRYWMGTDSKLQENQITLYNGVAFEEKTELTLFLLSCPYINN